MAAAILVAENRSFHMSRISSHRDAMSVKNNGLQPRSVGTVCDNTIKVAQWYAVKVGDARMILFALCPDQKFLFHKYGVNKYFSYVTLSNEQGAVSKVIPVPGYQ